MRPSLQELGAAWSEGVAASDQKVAAMRQALETIRDSANAALVGDEQNPVLRDIAMTAHRAIQASQR